MSMREKIIQAPATPESGKSKTFRASRHLLDQELKYDYQRQTSIFDEIHDEELKEEVKNFEKDIKITPGIKLSSAEKKIQLCLSKLLHQKSQTQRPENKDYYLGNQGFEIIKYGEGNTAPAPRLLFTLYELAKEFKGGEAPSGKDMKNVEQILRKLGAKKFLIIYTEKTFLKNGETIKDEMQMFIPLFNICEVSRTRTSKENVELSKQSVLTLLLNPIFYRQIDTYFYNLPVDIMKRIVEAHGSHNIPRATLNLINFLQQQHASKNYNPARLLDKLYHLVAEDAIKQGRKKRAKESVEKALETAQKIGLLDSYKIEPSRTTGDQKIVFKINKDWIDLRT